jgi:hypothetical protein
LARFGAPIDAEKRDGVGAYAAQRGEIIIWDVNSGVT